MLDVKFCKETVTLCVIQSIFVASRSCSFGAEVLSFEGFVKCQYVRCQCHARYKLRVRQVKLDSKYLNGRILADSSLKANRFSLQIAVSSSIKQECSLTSHEIRLA